MQFKKATGLILEKLAIHLPVHLSYPSVAHTKPSMKTSIRKNCNCFSKQHATTIRAFFIVDMMQKALIENHCFT